MQFNCDSCGLCCRKAYLVPELSEFIGADGQCRYFINNQCSIYEERPLICNIEKYYETFLSEVLTKEEFYQKNYTSCMSLKNEFIDPSSI
jgi:hypothetical protein